MNLAGFENLNAIGERASIFGNESLTSITGLENLTSIGGDLTIGLWQQAPWSYGNNSLISLTSLGNLTSIGGNLRIEDNDLLSSLTGLDNIEASSINNLYIQHNDTLSMCEVASICDYLASPTGTTEIYANESGCNNQQEVEDACGITGLSEPHLKYDISIFPNPASTELYISSTKGAIITEVNIYNQIGQKVLHHKPVTQPIDVSMLQSGMYIIEVRSKDFKVRKKVIIK